MKRLSILIADDHALLRRGLNMLLRTQKDFDVVGEAEDGVLAVKMSANIHPDIVIMDLSMPLMDGVEATKRIREEQPEVKVLILTTYGTSFDVARALKNGATGALVKDVDDEELISAIRKVASGSTYISPELHESLMQAPQTELTERQKQILTSIIHGMSIDTIASKLGISMDAVNQHLNAIRRKLGATNRSEAVAIALHKHLLKI